MLFSATLPAWVKKQTKNIFRQGGPVHLDLISGTNDDRTSDTVEHVALACPSEAYRLAVLPSVVLQYGQGRALIFAEQKRHADFIASTLSSSFPTVALHGDISQASREAALEGFRSGTYQCLVATDVAARGIDIPHVPLVVQFKPPNSSETFIHRTGRTGRAGRDGIAVLMYGGGSEARAPSRIEKETGCQFEFVADLAQAAGGGAALMASTIDAQLTPVHTRLAKDHKSAHKTRVDLAEVVSALEGQGWSQEDLLAAAIAELGKAAKPVPLPSLLPGGNTSQTTLMATVPDGKARSLTELVQQAMGRSYDGRIVAAGSLERGSRAGVFYFDVPTTMVESVLEASNEHIPIERAQRIMANMGGKGKGGGGKGGKGRDRGFGGGKGGGGGKGKGKGGKGGKGSKGGRRGSFSDRGRGGESAGGQSYDPTRLRAFQ